MDKIRIDVTVWHAQVYLWCMRLWKTFSSSREYIEILPTTNVCLYIRVLCAGILALVIYLGLATYAVASLLYYPTLYFGWRYWKVVGGVLAVVLAIMIFFVAVAGISAAGGAMKSWWWRRRHTIGHAVQTLEGTQDRPSAVALVREYVKSHTEGICVGIELVAQPQVDALPSKVSTSFEVRLPANANDSGGTSEATSESVRVNWITTSRISFLPSWGRLVLSGMALSLFLVIMWLTYLNTSATIEARWQGECKAEEWIDKKGVVALNVRCDGKEVTIKDVNTLVDIISKGEAPVCSESIEGTFYCAKADQSRVVLTGNR